MVVFDGVPIVYLKYKLKYMYIILEFKESFTFTMCYNFKCIDVQFANIYKYII